MRIVGNLALLLALLFLVFTQAGNNLAMDLFVRAHEHLTAYLTGILQGSL